MDLAQYGGAAAAAPIMDMMAPKDTGPPISLTTSGLITHTTPAGPAKQIWMLNAQPTPLVVLPVGS
jgi:hypothetical protein